MECVAGIVSHKQGVKHQDYCCIATKGQRWDFVLKYPYYARGAEACND